MGIEASCLTMPLHYSTEGRERLSMFQPASRLGITSWSFPILHTFHAAGDTSQDAPLCRYVLVCYWTVNQLRVVPQDLSLRRLAVLFAAMLTAIALR